MECFEAELVMSLKGVLCVSNCRYFGDRDAAYWVKVV